MRLQWKSNRQHFKVLARPNYMYLVNQSGSGQRFNLKSPSGPAYKERYRQCNDRMEDTESGDQMDPRNYTTTVAEQRYPKAYRQGTYAPLDLKSCIQRACLPQGTENRAMINKFRPVVHVQHRILHPVTVSLWHNIDNIMKSSTTRHEHQFTCPRIPQ